MAKIVCISNLPLTIMFLHLIYAFPEFVMLRNSFLIILLLFIILFDISTAFLRNHIDLPVYTEKMDRSIFRGKICHCGRKENLANMAPVKFESGHNYMVDAEPVGHGTYAKVYHAVRVNSEWRPYSEGNFNKCVAIKLPSVNEFAKTYLEEEAAVLRKIWNAFLNPVRPNHIIGLFEVEYFKTDEPRLNPVLVLEMGIKSLDNYWKETAELYKRHHYLVIHEFIVLKVLRQIAETIQEVHDRGFIYMDLKPANIVLTKEPQIGLLLSDNVDQLELKLIDFAGALEYDGFGRSSRKNSPIVKVQQPVCSPFYAPPEVMDKRTWGKPKKVSALSDLFSFGRLALEMIVQTPHFENCIVELKLYEKLRAEVAPGTPLTPKDIINKTLSTLKWWRKVPPTNRFMKFFNQLKKVYPHVIEIIMETQITNQLKRRNAKETLQKIDEFINSERFAVLKNLVRTMQNRHELLDMPALPPPEISSSEGNTADDEHSESESEPGAEIIQLVESKGKEKMHDGASTSGTKFVHDSTAIVPSTGHAEELSNSHGEFPETSSKRSGYASSGASSDEFFSVNSEDTNGAETSEAENTETF